MNDDLERQLARTLGDRATDPDYQPPDLSGFPRARARRRRRNGLLAGTLALAAVAGIGIAAGLGRGRDGATDYLADSPSPTSSSPTAPPSTSPSTRDGAVIDPTTEPTSGPDTSPEPRLTACSDMVLPEEGVGEADFNIDTAGETITISVSDMRGGEYVNLSYTVAYARDPTCWQVPAVKELIARVDPPGWPPPRSGSGFREDRNQECRHTVDSLNSGTPVEHGAVTADPDGLRELVEEWCPPRFAEELREQ